MRYRNNWTEAIVEGVSDAAEGIRELAIRPVAGAVPYGPGAHIDVQVLAGEAPEVRSYSLVGTYTAGAPYTIAVKQLPASRGGSRYMGTLQPGNRLRISQPVNHFELSTAKGSYLLLAAGIGITPLLGMAETLGQRADTEVSMFYLGRTPGEMPYRERLEGMLGERLTCHFSGSEGRPDLQRLLDEMPADTRLYLCGPLGLMNDVRAAWERSGMPNAHMRYETFGASGAFAPQPFRVHLPRFERTLEVSERQTLLQVLEEEGIDVISDCRKGECGLCQVEVLEYTGDIDHRDCFFSDAQKAENRKMCACVSRVANGELTIDTSYRKTASEAPCVSSEIKKN